MTTNITSRLRYNYVLAELDSLLFEDFVGYAVVTEEFIHRGYEERFGKTLTKELAPLGFTLQQLVEHVFGTDLLWVSAPAFKGVVPRSLINRPSQVSPVARDLRIVSCPKIETPNALPVQMVPVPTGAAWKDKQRVEQLASYFEENEAIFDDTQLENARAEQRKKLQKDRVRMSINLVEFYALTKFGGDLTLEHFQEIQRQSGHSDFEGRRFGPEIEGLRLRIVDKPFENYGLHHIILGALQKCNVTERVGGKLHFPNLPAVAVFVRKRREPGVERPLALAAMENLVIVEEKELIFTSIRLARKRQSPSADARDVKTGPLIEL